MKEQGLPDPWTSAGRVRGDGRALRRGRGERVRHRRPWARGLPGPRARGRRTSSRSSGGRPDMAAAVTLLLALTALLAAPGAARAVVQLELVASGLERPCTSPSPATAPAGSSWSSSPAGSRSCRPTAATPRSSSTSPTRCSPGGEQGLLGLAFHPQLRDQRPLLRQLHAPARRRHRDRRVPGVGRRPRRRRSGVGEHRSSSSRSRSPTTTAAWSSSGPTACSTSALGDGGSGERSGQPCPEPRRAAREDAPHRRRPTGGGPPYAAPPTTPSPATAGPRRDLRRGFRNPFRFSFDRATGDLWAGDVGQSAREEIDVVTSGRQLRLARLRGHAAAPTSSPASCAAPGFIPPVTEYAHSGRAARSPAATSIGARRHAARRAPTCSATSARERSSASTAGPCRCCSTRRCRSRRSARTRPVRYVVGLGGTVYRLVDR